MGNEEMEAATPSNGWQKMDSAPKDGTSIIVYTEFDGFVPWVSWIGNGRVSESCAWNGQPIAWMPFPDAPSWSDDEGN